MKIGDRVFVHGYVDEIRKDTIIIRNDGGYFGTIPSEVIEERFMITSLPSAQPERVWTPCDIPPEHHKDVIVRGVEAIGDVAVYKIMQWDVDRWRPENYAPSITWLDWSEI